MTKSQQQDIPRLLNTLIPSKQGPPSPQPIQKKHQSEIYETSERIRSTQVISPSAVMSNHLRTKLGELDALDWLLPMRFTFLRKHLLSRKEWRKCDRTGRDAHCAGVVNATRCHVVCQIASRKQIGGAMIRSLDLSCSTILTG